MPTMGASIATNRCLSWEGSLSLRVGQGWGWGPRFDIEGAEAWPGKGPKSGVEGAPVQ